MLISLQTMSADRGLQQKMMTDRWGDPTDKPNPDYVGEHSPYFWICGRDTLETLLWLTMCCACSLRKQS